MTWVERKEIEKTVAHLRRVLSFALRVIDTHGQGMAVTATCYTWSRCTAELLPLCYTRRRLGPWAPNLKYLPLILKFLGLRSRPRELATR